MRRNEKLKNWLLVIGEFMSAAWTVFNLWLSFIQYETKYNSGLFALIGFTVFAILVLSRNIFQNNIINAVTPNIIMIDNPFSEKGSIDMTTTIVPFGGGYKSEEKTRYMGIDAILVKVIFSNFPKNPTEENNARNVRAQISYSDALGNTLFSARGRWEVSKSEDCENIELNQMAYQKHYI